MKKIINRDYIGVIVKNANHLLEYMQIPINDSSLNVYEELKAMGQNDNRTVLDLQNTFQQHFRSCPKYFPYYYPYPFSSTYIQCTTYPKCLTYDEYQKKIKDSSNNSLKTDFLNSAYIYIIAYAYSKKLESLSHNNANKMFSLESTGWNAHYYPINQDITIEVCSNFGYGRSSYFYVNFKYKGIDILPYSDLVRYYKANMIDFIRYTRQYCPERDNWDLALNFVVETANYAIKDESAFVSKWIFNEIEEMMAGLELIAKNPQGVYSKLSSQEINIFGLVNVRNITSTEKKNYLIFPTETVIAIQAEKITGALQFMENIASLKEVYPKAEEVINRIKQINTELYPRFKEAITRIEDKITLKQNQVDILTEEENKLVEICKPYEDKISKIYEKADKEAKAKDPDAYVSMSEIKQDFINNNNDYKIILEKIDSIRNEISPIESMISGLKDFIDQLNDCVKNIIKYTEVA